MSSDELRATRELADRLVAWCSQAGGSDLPAVGGSFKCWTPLGDWEAGPAGLEALRRVLVGAGAPGVPIRTEVAIADGEVVVAELSSGITDPMAAITLVLSIHDGLLDEVRCYVDPRALGVAGTSGSAPD